MKRCNYNGVVYHQFASLLSFEITHAVFSRHGGVSAPPFHTLNVGRLTADVPKAVETNLARTYETAGLTASYIVSGRQVHGTNVAGVTAQERGQILPATDALVTNVKGIGLMLRFADCVPIMFYDPVHQAIGIAHAGWRGTVGKIAQKTARVMMSEYGTCAADLVVGIGPSIGSCCYEIGAEVIDAVKISFPRSSQLLTERNGAVHFDLWEANRVQLTDVGVTQIEIARICTACHADEFFSHRAEGGITGRFGAIIVL